MDLTIDFSVLIRAVYWVAAAAVLASILLILQISIMRMAAQARMRHLGFFEPEWSKILRGPARQIKDLPGLAKSEVTPLMILWNQAQEAALYGASGDPGLARYLNEIARRCGLDRIAIRRLRSRSIGERLSAIIMLGHLRERSALPLLEEMTNLVNSLLSLAAARACLQIDHAQATAFVSLTARRSDWSSPKLLAVVREEAASLADPMLTSVGTLRPAESSRLVQYLVFFERARSLATIRHILESSEDSTLISEALKVLAQIGSPPDAALAAKFAKHAEWPVRVQVANALGRLQDRAQISVLTSLLDDRHWWVRYRSAQALATLTGGDETLGKILEAQQDRFARDALRQVIGERSLALRGSDRI